MLNYAKHTVVASMVGLGMEGMDIMFLSFAMTLIVKDFHISLTAGGLISTVTNWGMLIGGIFFGILSDYFGRVRVFTYTIILFAVGTALTALASNIEQVYLFRFISGLGAGGEYGIGMALVTEAWPKEWRGRATSYVSIGGQIGTILAALLSAIILPSLGWRPLFFIGIIPVIIAFVIRRNLEESPAWVKANQEKNQKDKAVPLIHLFNSPRRSFTTIALIVMTTVQVSGYYGLMVWLPSILQKNQGFSLSGSSLWMVTTIIGMIFGMLSFGNIMDKVGRKQAYIIFLLMAALSVFLYSLASSKLEVLIGGAIVGFFANGMYAGYGTLISEYYPIRALSTAQNTIFNIGRAVGGIAPIIIGFFLQNYNIIFAMGFVSILYIISLAMLLTLKKSSNETGIID